MIYNRTQVLGLIRPKQWWSGFDDFLYEFYVVPITWSLANLRTCWPPRDTFLEVAANMLARAVAGESDDLTQKVLSLAESLDARPILIPVVLHRDLKTRWPAEYPADSPVPNDALIAEDGDRRLSALGIRSLRGDPVRVSHIGLFVGYLHLPENVGQLLASLRGKFYS